jgi:hypothetical protein
MTIRLIKHEVIPNCRSYEVPLLGWPVPQFFYWDDETGRRVRPDQHTSEQVLKLAREFAQAMRGRP